MVIFINIYNNKNLRKAEQGRENVSYFHFINDFKRYLIFNLITVHLFLQGEWLKVATAEWHQEKIIIISIFFTIGGWNQI